MNVIKTIPALLLLTLSLNAKPSGNGMDAVEKIKSSLICPAEMFENKNQNEVRLSFKVNDDGKAEEVIINAENEKMKLFIQEKLKKMQFSEKGEIVNVLLKFKLQ